MAQLSESQRTALGYWWNLITDAVKAGFSATDTTSLANQVAHDLGSSLNRQANNDIAVLYGYAKRIDNAGNALQSASRDKFIDSNLMAIAPWARDVQERNDYPIYHVKFQYVYIDQAGVKQSVTRTDAIKMALPGTVGELFDQVLSDAEAMALKYGHQLLSVTPLQILVI